MTYYGRPKPKYSYSAIVYKDGNTVIAEDAYGKTIAEGEAGIDDAKVIQSAIDSINQGKILLDGEFIIKNQEGQNYGLILHSNTELTGIPYKTIIKNNMTASGNNYLITNENRFNTQEYDTNISIKNITIDYNKYYPTSPYYPFVMFSNIKGINIENVKFINHKGDGGHHIQFFAAEDITIKNCKIEGAEVVIKNGTYYGADGISLGEGTSYALEKGCRNVVIDNVIIKDTIDDAILAGASSSSYNIKIVNSTIDKTNGYAGSSISIYGGSTILIQGCTIKGGPDAGAIGIRYNGSEDIKIINNTIEVNNPTTSTLTNKGKAIVINTTASDVIIKNNKIYGDFLDHIIEIRTQANNINIKDNTIKVNSKELTGQTIRITNGAYNITIQNNYIEDSTTNTNYNILLDSTVSDIKILHNNLKNSNPTSENIIINGSNITVRFNILNPSKPIYIVGGTYTIEKNTGYQTENYGTASITGDGSTTTFTISHGLVSTPNYVNVIPKGSAPKPDSIDADATNITLTFSTAPASGTYYYYWEARV